MLSRKQQVKQEFNRCQIQKNPPCKACGGTGKSSKGRRCEPCQGTGKKHLPLSKRLA